METQKNASFERIAFARGAKEETRKRKNKREGEREKFLKSVRNNKDESEVRNDYGSYDFNLSKL